MSSAGFWSSLSWADPYTLFSRTEKEKPVDVKEWFITEYTSPVSQELSHAVCRFLETHFGDPPRTPTFCLPPDELLSAKDWLYVAHRSPISSGNGETDGETDGEIVGCVRYRWIGARIDRSHYVVDAFCVHPRERGTGIGRALLLRLHRDANQRGIPYAIFLKEGRPLAWWIRPLYTGRYVYRDTATARPPCRGALRTLPTRLAHRFLRIYASIHPDVFIVFPGHTENQSWKLYQSGDHPSHTLLVCIQDTHQQNRSQRLGWVTAWLESACMTDEHRHRAAEAVCASMDKTYSHLWFNREWVPFIASSAWKEDGGFQWYSFQWSATMTGRSYCLLHG